MGSLGVYVHYRPQVGDYPSDVCPVVEPAKPANNSSPERQDAPRAQEETVWRQEPLGEKDLFTGEPPKFLGSPEASPFTRFTRSQRPPDPALWPLGVYLLLIFVLIVMIFLAVFAFG